MYTWCCTVKSQQSIRENYDKLVCFRVIVCVCAYVGGDRSRGHGAPSLRPAASRLRRGTGPPREPRPRQKEARREGASDSTGVRASVRKRGRKREREEDGDHRVSRERGAALSLSLSFFLLPVLRLSSLPLRRVTCFCLTRARARVCELSAILR